MDEILSLLGCDLVREGHQPEVGREVMAMIG